jgi:BirA family biotin operon repressor/biotin-[acetyl-CoA-carboxylase] ligase
VVVTAEHQRAGRGRLGRTWWDAPGESLMCSVLLRPPVPPAAAPALALVAAVAVAEAVERAAGVAPALRWPNDVVAGGRKLGGILAEAVVDGDGRLRHVILGMGLNVNQEAFPGPLGDVATSLRRLTGRPHDRERLLEALLAALEARYAQFLSGGFAAVAPAWRARSVTPGRPVLLPDGRRATALDVAEDGALRVRLASGSLESVTAGEVRDAPAG